MTHTLKQSKRARKYGLGSAAIVLATVASNSSKLRDSWQRQS
ncbi:Uncharacterised protein [Streptococcus equi subsp. equi]|uniref:Uncharacterized protein n=1 Tax=Streptococcus equi subsp. equi TaxID=148942 RepID=A0A380JMD9_9STRE|nr:hypothetical protein [Streptococcus equi]SUN44771.1 Uncharacterised protein [Streptococcus equi subsp. equi]